jgi:predicted GIY-YIG superfamily endonuclease
MSQSDGIHFDIFIPHNQPEGLRLINIKNWIGQGIVFPRHELPQASQRKELKRSGVYILWDPTGTFMLPSVYIGQSDNVQNRLTTHDREKDFWNQAAVFTTVHENGLGQTEVSYLEARLIELAKTAKRCKLKNSNRPTPDKLAEADKNDLERFLENMLLCLPLAGVNFFQKLDTSQSGETELLLKRGKQVIGRGFDRSDGFLVLKGSQATLKVGHNLHGHLTRLRAALCEENVLKEEGDTYVITRDHLFPSPHIAASVLLGHSVNAIDTWKDAEGHRLREIREQAIQQD